jgi:hypothetical protein
MTQRQEASAPVGALPMASNRNYNDTSKRYQTHGFPNPAKSRLAPGPQSPGLISSVSAAPDTETLYWKSNARGMPFDPKECRRQALACVRLAQTSGSPQARRHYANLAKSWLTLAGDLETVDAQLESESEKRKAWIARRCTDDRAKISRRHGPSRQYRAD